MTTRISFLCCALCLSWMNPFLSGSTASELGILRQDLRNLVQPRSLGLIALGIGGGLLLGLVMGHRIGHYGRGRSARVSMRHAAARREEGAARRGEGAARRGEGAPRRSDAAAPASTSETFMSA